MTNDILMILGASGIRGTMRDYTYQLSRAGLAIALPDTSANPNLNGGGTLGHKLASWRSLAQSYSQFTYLVFSDAFDVSFFGRSAIEIARRIPMARVLFAAEKNCYPDPAIAARIPDRGPWRFVNGGLAAGTPRAILEFCDRTERHPHYRPHGLDQELFNIMLTEDTAPFDIDDRTSLFYCLYGGYDELQFEQGAPVNTLYGTHPLFVHANGQWSAEAMFDRHRQSLAMKK